MKNALSLFLFLLLAMSSQSAAGGTMFHRAENDVPVVITEIRPYISYTEIHMRTLAPLDSVCWSYSGPNSPYLLSEGMRYQFLNGDFISSCPETVDYGTDDLMILRFEPFVDYVSSFHLVEGEGGENQLIDPASSAGVRYWNFLNVSLE